MTRVEHAALRAFLSRFRVSARDKNGLPGEHTTTDVAMAEFLSAIGYRYHYEQMQAPNV